MTNPTSSNTGMSALFAVASAVAGKTEDLSEKEVNGTVLKAFLAGQTLTAGSSGWLAEAYARDPSALDAMINYEAVILRANASLADKDRLVIIHPRDGVITADYPLMLLNERRRDAYTRLVAAFKSVAVQQNLAASAFLRPALPDVPTVAEQGYPGFEMTQWYGLLVPSKWPKAHVAKIEAEAIRATRSAVVKDKLAQDTALAVGNTGAEFDAFIKAEQARWKPVIARAQIKPDGV